MERLRTIVHTQRWGIAEVAPAGWTLYFKGGWGNGTGLVDHQVALLQRGRERVSVAILTTISGTHRDGKATLRGVARRLLRGSSAVVAISRAALGPSARAGRRRQTASRWPPICRRPPDTTIRADSCAE